MNSGFKGTGNLLQIRLKKKIPELWHGDEEEDADEEEGDAQFYQGEPLMKFLGYQKFHTTGLHP